TRAGASAILPCALLMVPCRQIALPQFYPPLAPGVTPRTLHADVPARGGSDVGPGGHNGAMPGVSGAFPRFVPESCMSAAPPQPASTAATGSTSPRDRRRGV